MNKYTKISLYIVITFAFAMFVSFIPEQFPAFFGDWSCTDVIHYHYGNTYYAPHIHWGYRHWLLVSMSGCLFILGFIRVIDEIS